MMVARKDKTVRAQKARKLGIPAGIVYHTVSKLNYSARLHILRSIDLRVYGVLTVGRRKSEFVKVVSHNYTSMGIKLSFVHDYSQICKL